MFIVIYVTRSFDRYHFCVLKLSGSKDKVPFPFFFSLAFQDPVGCGDAYKSFKTVQKHIFAVRMATKQHHSTTLEHPTLKCRRKPKHRGVFAPNLRQAEENLENRKK